jgi:hypothetical protein
MSEWYKEYIGDDVCLFSFWLVVLTVLAVLTRWEVGGALVEECVS